MSGKRPSGDQVSTACIAALISLYGSGQGVFKAFQGMAAQGASLQSWIKAGLCLLFFAGACLFLQRRKFFQDHAQHRSMMHLRLRFSQVLPALAVLVFWAFFQIVLFGKR
jgi:hypothetical protein